MIRQILLIAIGLAAGAALAQEKPADVTDAQVSIYQLGLEIACKNAGRKRGESPEKVDAFCICATKVLKEKASQAEWQTAYFHFRKGQRREARAVLAPHMASLETCKAEASDLIPSR